MEKINYQKELEKIISQFSHNQDGTKPSLLLHACCGPCSSYVIEYLSGIFDITIYYYNPNIMDREEYLRRREALLKFIDAFNADNEGRTRVEYLEGEYDPERFIRLAEPMKDEPEGGKRCDMCFAMRLSDTAKMSRIRPERSSTFTPSSVSIMRRFWSNEPIAEEKRGERILQNDRTDS